MSEHVPVRRSFVIALVVVVALACTWTTWKIVSARMDAAEQSRDDAVAAAYSARASAWTEAGQSAIQRLQLPGSFAKAKAPACPAIQGDTCFLAAGTPVQEWPAVLRALRAISNGPTQRARCHSLSPTPVPGMPPVCDAYVPVAGSLLSVAVWPRLTHVNGKRAWQGSTVQVGPTVWTP
jgi:hypothetical protein